jgi:hypothetical protein
MRSYQVLKHLLKRPPAQKPALKLKLTWLAIASWFFGVGLQGLFTPN